MKNQPLVGIKDSNFNETFCFFVSTKVKIDRFHFDFNEAVVHKRREHLLR